MMLHHWKAEAQSSDYCGAWDFQPNEKKTVTITGTRREVVHDPNGKGTEKLIVLLKEIKPLVLNSTNGKMITQVLKTPYTEHWIGKKIVLAVEQVRAFGCVCDAVRVQKTVVQNDVNCADCGKVITSVDGFTADQIANSSKAKFGRCLCMECAKKAGSEK